MMIGVAAACTTVGLTIVFQPPLKAVAVLVHPFALALQVIITTHHESRSLPIDKVTVAMGAVFGRLEDGEAALLQDGIEEGVGKKRHCSSARAPESHPRARFVRMHGLEIDAMSTAVALKFQGKRAKDVGGLLASGLKREGAAMEVRSDLDVAVVALFHLLLHPVTDVADINTILRGNAGVSRQFQFELEQLHHEKRV